MASDGKRQMAISEQEIISRYLAPLARQNPEALGLRDDAAWLRPKSGHDLVISCDTLIAGVHFGADDPADLIAGKALAVNISDLVAKAATPVAYLLSLALPKAPDAAWMSGFAAGLKQAGRSYGCRLLGGDTTRIGGPLTITITAIGELPTGTMVRRSTAKAGDKIVVSGQIGEAAMGLLVRQQSAQTKRWGLSPAALAQFERAYLAPQPRLPLVPLLRRYATAAMDVSDGLIGDLAKLLSASGMGGVIRLDAVPFSDAARQIIAADPGQIERLVTGGDDYEILATIPAKAVEAYRREAAAFGVDVTEIGEIGAADNGLQVLGPDDKPVTFKTASFQHF